MSISDEEKAELHFMLDYLLNTREGLERINPSVLSPGLQFSSSWSQPRREFTLNASKFLRRLIGERLHGAELQILDSVETLEEEPPHADYLATLANALRSFFPLFAPTKEGVQNSAFISNMINDFIAISWGDEPRFFSISTKAQGMHKRPFRLAYLRLSALEWEKYLETVGVSAFERQRLISDAYRTNWDAIRKWKHSIAEQFDLVPYPPRWPDIARAEYSESSEAVHHRIVSDGNDYWMEKNRAKSAKVGREN